MGTPYPCGGCCECIWLQHVWARDGWTADARIALYGGAVYDGTRMRVQIPGGGKLRSVEAPTVVEGGVVSVKLRLEDPVVLTDAYGEPYFANDEHIRIYFESDDAEANYKYVDLRKVAKRSGGATGYLGFWLMELGTRTAGVDAMLHYEFAIMEGDTGGNTDGIRQEADADGELQEVYVQLSRFSSAENTMQGYVAWMTGRSRDLTPKVYLPAHPPDTREQRITGPTHVGAGREVVLSDPPGTHFGIKRLDADTYVTELAALAVGRLKLPYDAKCITGSDVGHPVCLENARIECTPTVNASYALVVPPPAYWGTLWSINKTSFVQDYKVQGPNDGTHDTVWYVRLFMELVTAPAGTTPSAGQSTTTLRVQTRVSEETYRISGGALEGSYVAEWDVSTAVADHAMTCNGLSFEFLIADATVTNHATTQTMKLQKVVWALSTS